MSVWSNLCLPNPTQPFLRDQATLANGATIWCFFVTNVSTTFISYKWDRFYWTSPNQNLYFWTLFWLRSSPIRLKEVTLTYSFPKFVRLVFWPKNRKTEEIRSLFRVQPTGARSDKIYTREKKSSCYLIRERHDFFSACTIPKQRAATESNLWPLQYNFKALFAENDC